MCGPQAAIAAASFAFQAASTMAQAADQKKAAQQQQDMIQAGYAKEQAATARQYEDIQRSAMDQQAQRHTEYLIDSARLRAVAGESGLAGVSQEREDQVATNNAETDMATLEANRRSQAEQAHTNAVSRASQADVQLAGIRKPSALGVGLQIGSQLVGSYAAYDASAKKAAKAATAS